MEIEKKKAEDLIKAATFIGYRYGKESTSNNLSAEELRIKLQKELKRNGGDERKLQDIYELFREGEGNRRIIAKKLTRPYYPSCLIYWFSNRTCAESALEGMLENIIQGGRFPPVSIPMELAYLPTYEFNYCIVFRTFSLFISLLEEWIGSLNYSPIEEYIEEGKEVLEYYKQNATIIRSVNITSTGI